MAGLSQIIREALLSPNSELQMWVLLYSNQVFSADADSEDAQLADSEDHSWSVVTNPEFYLGFLCSHSPAALSVLASVNCL